MKQLFQAGIFAGDVAIVTGGGTGIGLQVARELGTLGCKVAICGRRPEPLETAKASLEADGVEVLTQTCDIRKVEEVGAFVDAVVARFGKVDVLVNNAGGQFPSAAEHVAPKGFEAVVRNNLLGTWTMIHTVATKAMIPKKRGRIVNVTAQVTRGFPGMVHTGAARAGVENLTKTLAVEWAMHGIRVNAVAPGVIKTSGTAQYPPDLLALSTKHIPLKRMGGEEEVSHLIVYLCSPQADYVTGQVMLIDGGQSLWSSPWIIPDDLPQFPPYPVD